MWKDFEEVGLEGSDVPFYPATARAEGSPSVIRFKPPEWVLHDQRIRERPRQLEAGRTRQIGSGWSGARQAKYQRTRIGANVR